MMTAVNVFRNKEEPEPDMKKALQDFYSRKYLAIQNEDYEGNAKATAKALTAIYEKGLECIGADVDEYSWNDGRTTGTVKSQQVITENKLRASQRKAWAKACGVAEK